MSKNYTFTVRRLIVANPAACNVIYRMAAGSEIEIERLLNDASKMVIVLRNVTRVKMSDIERMIENISTPGIDNMPASYGDIQTVLMQNYVQNRKNR